MPPSATDPSTSIREGVSHQWAATLGGYRGMRYRPFAGHRYHGSLRFHRDYDLDFWVKRVGDIPLTLTTPLLSSLIGNIIHPERPESFREPPSFQMDRDQWGGVPTMSQTPITSPIKEKAYMWSTSEGEVPEDKPLSQVEGLQDKPPLEPDRGAEPKVVVIDTDEDSNEESQGSSTLRSG